MKGLLVHECMQHIFVLGGVSQDIPNGLVDDILRFCKSFKYRINEMETVLTNNFIWETTNCGCGGCFIRRCIKLWFYRCGFKIGWKLIGIYFVFGNLMMLICKINVPINGFT